MFVDPGMLPTDLPDTETGEIAKAQLVAPANPPGEGDLLPVILSLTWSCGTRTEIANGTKPWRCGYGRPQQQQASEDTAE